MKKKLYKAKKNWVIGFIAATTLILGGTTIASADSNASSVNSNLASQSQVSTYPSFKSLVVTSTQDSPTVGMSSQIASNPVGDYNKDNVGYINPNQERNVYNDQVENDSYKINDPGSLKYREKLLNGFAKGNDQINKYKTPSVYEYMGDANNPYKYVDPQPITSINKWDTPTYHFLNNGISNAIHYENTNGDPNYEAINHLSQALSYADYQHLTDLYSHTHQDKNFGVFYDGDKAIIAPNSGLTTEDLDALYWAAYKNRPIVTFDDTVHGHHITSFLQSSIQAFDDGWKLSFDAGWRGYTFMDGEQIRFTDIIRSNSKKFSWKNVILKYFAQSLAYKSNEGSQRTPYMLTRSNYLPATDIPNNGGPLENPLNPSITEFIFTNFGVYAIINGAMGGYNPILVHVPMAFLNSDFHYGTNEEPEPHQNHHSTNTDKSDDNTVDIDKLDKEYISNSYNGIFKDAGDVSAAGLTIGKEKGWFSKDKEGLVGIAKKFISFAGNLTKDLGHSLSNVLSDAGKFGAGIVDEFVNVWKDKISKGNSFFAKILKEGTKVGTYTRRFGIASAVFDTGSLGSKLFKMHEDSKKDKKDLNKAASVRKQDFKKERKNMLDTIKSALTVALDAVSAVPGAVAISAAVVGLALPFLALGIYKVLNNDTKYLAKFRLRRKK